MATLTVNMLIEAFSKLTPEERARPLLIDTSPFFSVLEKTPDEVSLFGLNEMAFVLSPTIKSSPKKDRTLLMTFSVKSPDNPDYAIIGVTKGQVFNTWFQNCQKAAVELNKRPEFNQNPDADDYADD